MTKVNKKRNIVLRIVIALITILVLVITIVAYKLNLNSITSIDLSSINVFFDIFEGIFYFLAIGSQQVYYFIYGLFCSLKKEISKLDIVFFVVLSLIILFTSFFAKYTMNFYFELFNVWLFFLFTSFVVGFMELVTNDKHEIMNGFLITVILIILIIVIFENHNSFLIKWHSYLYLIIALFTIGSSLIVLKKERKLKDYIVFTLLCLTIFSFFYSYSDNFIFKIIAVISLVINIIFVIYTVIDYFIYRKNSKKLANN